MVNSNYFPFVLHDCRGPMCSSWPQHRYFSICGHSVRTTSRSISEQHASHDGGEANSHGTSVQVIMTEHDGTVSIQLQDAEGILEAFTVPAEEMERECQIPLPLVCFEQHYRRQTRSRMSCVRDWRRVNHS